MHCYLETLLISLRLNIVGNIWDNANVNMSMSVCIYAYFNVEMLHIIPASIKDGSIPPALPQKNKIKIEKILIADIQ